MSEVGIDEAVRAHMRRNAALLRRLEELGTDVERERTVDIHFWARDHESAVTLAKRLYERGHVVTVLSPAADESDGRWNVEAQACCSARVAASRARTEDLVQLAVEAGAEYDGWGTEAD